MMSKQSSPISNEPATFKLLTLAMAAKSTWPESVDMAALLPKAVQAQPGVQVPHSVDAQLRMSGLKRSTNWKRSRDAVEYSTMGMQTCDSPSEYAIGGPLIAPR